MKMLEKFDIVIFKDFSSFPAGRFYSDGDESGQAFREKHLIPLLKLSKEKIYIDLDKTEGYGSSFLEESFGGLVREGYPSDSLLGIFCFKSDEDPSLVDEIREYIKNGGNPREY